MTLAAGFGLFTIVHFCYKSDFVTFCYIAFKWTNGQLNLVYNTMAFLTISSDIIVI